MANSNSCSESSNADEMELSVPSWELMTGTSTVVSELCTVHYPRLVISSFIGPAAEVTPGKGKQNIYHLEQQACCYKTSSIDVGPTTTTCQVSANTTAAHLQSVRALWSAMLDELNFVPQVLFGYIVNVDLKLYITGLARRILNVHIRIYFYDMV